MKTLNSNLLKLKLRAAALARLRVSSGVLITLDKINGTFSVKAKGLLAGVFKRILPAVGLEITYPMMGAILLFIQRCKDIHKAQGMPGLVKYLKSAGVLLQQALAGQVLKDAGTLGPRVSRNASGLPRFIPRLHRARIHNGDLRLAQFWLTLINLFRVLEFTGKVNLRTITDPQAPCPEHLKDVYEFVTSQGTMDAFVESVNSLTGTTLRAEVREFTPEPFSIAKSSPQTVGAEGISDQNASTKPYVLFTSALALMNSGMADKVDSLFRVFWGPGHMILSQRLREIFAALCHFSPGLKQGSLAPTLIGKLGFKAEPAGKVRVFAMVTAWDQWSLKPLHDAMFRILRLIPQDGTHNQLGPLARIDWKAAFSLWSLDLTAATDRLPLFLQAQLLQTLYRDLIGVLGDLWSLTLTDRDYLASSTRYGINQMVRYTCGQPMGALSSWASLALTHHFLVQAAAWHSGVVPFGTWFKDYAIVGDDIVIFNALVKDSYLAILSALGMPINLAKSILSPRGIGLEFCKRTIIRGVDVSPVPLKEFVAANLTLPEAVSFAHKYNLTFNQLLLVLGYGWKVRAGIDKHIGQLNARVRGLLFAFMLPPILSEVTDLSKDQLGALLSRGNPNLSKEQQAYFLLTLLLVIKQFVIHALRRVLRSRSSVDTLVSTEMDGFNRVLVNRLLLPFLVREATGPNAISNPRVPVTWTGIERILGTPEHFLSARPATSIEVPPEVLMGFRDLIHSVRGPLEELIDWIIRSKVNAKTRLAKELALALKAFRPELDSPVEGFRDAIKLLELLVELTDIDPSLDRESIVIPRRFGHDKSEHLWMLFTRIIGDFNRLLKSNPSVMMETAQFSREIGMSMTSLSASNPGKVRSTKSRVK